MDSEFSALKSTAPFDAGVAKGATLCPLADKIVIRGLSQWSYSGQLKTRTSSGPRDRRDTPIQSAEWNVSASVSEKGGTLLQAQTKVRFEHVM